MELENPRILDNLGLQLLFPFYFETVVIGWSRKVKKFDYNDTSKRIKLM
mgnify:CR=1 FL=1